MRSEERVLWNLRAGATRKDYTGYEKDMSNAEFGLRNPEWKPDILPNYPLAINLCRLQ